jgi:NAD+ diphosphatase
VTFRHCPRCATELVPRIDEGRARARCPREGCGFVHYDNPVPVVAGIVERDGHIVLVREKYMPEKWFGLVTGFLEREEDPAAGVLREIKEEIGLDGRIERLVGVYPFVPMNQVIIAYHVRAEGEIVQSDEIAGFKIIPIEKVRPWPFGTGEALRDFLSSRGSM